jgi:hypothetical protein
VERPIFEGVAPGTDSSGTEREDRQRRQLGEFLLIGGIVMLATMWMMFPSLSPIPLVLGLQHPGVSRQLIHANAVIALLFLLAAAAFSMKPVRSMVRSPLSWLAVACLVVALLWGALTG